MTRLAIALVVAHGVVWAVFLRVLAAAGHAPSGPLAVPIERADYYAAQAWFVLPVVAGGVLAQSAALHAAASRLGGQGAWSTALQAAAFASSGAGLACWLIPELIAYAALGFGALPSVLRVVVPAFALVSFLVAAAWTKRGYGLGGARALAASFAGAFVYAVLTTPFLR